MKSEDIETRWLNIKKDLQQKLILKSIYHHFLYKIIGFYKIKEECIIQSIHDELVDFPLKMIRFFFRLFLTTLIATWIIKILSITVFILIICFSLVFKFLKNKIEDFYVKQMGIIIIQNQTILESIFSEFHNAKKGYLEEVLILELIEKNDDYCGFIYQVSKYGKLISQNIDLNIKSKELKSLLKKSIKYHEIMDYHQSQKSRIIDKYDRSIKLFPDFVAEILKKSAEFSADEKSIPKTAEELYTIFLTIKKLQSILPIKPQEIPIFKNQLIDALAIVYSPQIIQYEDHQIGNQLINKNQLINLSGIAVYLLMKDSLAYESKNTDKEKVSVKLNRIMITGSIPKTFEITEYFDQSFWSKLCKITSIKAKPIEHIFFSEQPNMDHHGDRAAFLL